MRATRLAPCCGASSTKAQMVCSEMNCQATTNRAVPTSQSSQLRSCAARSR